MLPDFPSLDEFLAQEYTCASLPPGMPLRQEIQHKVNSDAEHCPVVPSFVEGQRLVTRFLVKMKPFRELEFVVYVRPGHSLFYFGESSDVFISSVPLVSFEYPEQQIMEKCNFALQHSGLYLFPLLEYIIRYYIRYYRQLIVNHLGE